MTGVAHCLKLAYYFAFFAAKRYHGSHDQNMKLYAASFVYQYSKSCQTSEPSESNKTWINFP